MDNTSYNRVSFSSHPGILPFLRILLGIILLWKSINFIRDTVITKTYIEQTGIGVFSNNSEVLSLVITYLGLLCGVFIFIGFITRVAAIVQIPVLLIAVFFINIRNISGNTFEFILSLITLALLILFAIKGSGPLSADEYFRTGRQIDRDASEHRPSYK